MVYPGELAWCKVNNYGLLKPYCSVAAQCPIPTHIAMHGDIGGKVYGWSGGDSGGKKVVLPAIPFTIKESPLLSINKIGLLAVY
jgi:hypothetical protein